MEKVCLDTDIIIEYLLNKQETVQRIAALEKEADIAVTPLVLFELFSIAEASEKPEENKKIIAALARRMTVLELGLDVCAEAARLFAEAQKAKKKIELRDLFVGLVTMQRGYTLFTMNQEGYQEIPGMKLYKE
ncbi:MAG: type II toxin-antitoxin system VapC family toxin [Nanoarchaeota archaeon]